MTDQFRIIGQLEAQVESIDKRVENIEKKIDALTEYIQQQKGGAKLIWAIAGAGGIAGVALTKLGSALLGLLVTKP